MEREFLFSDDWSCVVDRKMEASSKDFHELLVWFIDTWHEMACGPPTHGWDLPEHGDDDRIGEVQVS